MKVENAAYEVMPLKFPEVPTTARYQLQQLIAEASGEPPEMPEVFCDNWEELEAKLVEMYEAEAIQRPYDILKAELEKAPAMQQEMETQIAGHLISGAAPFTLESVKSLVRD